MSSASTLSRSPRSPSRIACESLTATVSDPSPCSACAARSSDSASTSAPSDAITVRSDGPANPSIPTTPDTCRLASCTHRMPGPTITSTRGIDSVPYASAATACAPVTAKYASTPHSCAAATIIGCGAPTT